MFDPSPFSYLFLYLFNTFIPFKSRSFPFDPLIMKSFLFALALLVSCVAALRSGIYDDDGKTIIQPPVHVETLNVARRTEPLTPTHTERLTNADRLRRGLLLLPPTRRSGAR